MIEANSHPFRDDKAKPARAVKDAPLHAPCPNCYADCVATGKSLPSSGELFECACGMAFFRFARDARRHTQWLLTRGRVSVQIAQAGER